MHFFRAKKRKNPPKTHPYPKKIKNFHIDNQRDGEKKSKKMKKNFVSFGKGCIFAVPFEWEKLRVRRGEIIEETETEGSVPVVVPS